MKQLIRDFCENEQNTENILTIDLPTGTGKTFTVIEYMTDRVKHGIPGQMVFTTTLRNNLPMDDIREAFDRAGIGDRFDTDVLACKPTLESFLEGMGKLDRSDLDDIRTFVDDQDIFGKIERIWYDVSRQGDDDTVLDRDMAEKIYGQEEREFRKVLKKTLRERYRKSSDRRNAVTVDADKTGLQWVHILYPAVRTWDCPILVMSIHKLINRYDTVIGENTRFCDSDFLNGALVFMDEFDAAWSTMLQVISENSIGMSDQVSMFRRIMSGLSSRKKKPASVYKVTNSYSDRHGEKALEEYADQLYEHGMKLSEEHHLEYDFKLIDGIKRNFIFRDFKTLNIGKDDYFNVRFDEENHINVISNRDDGTGVKIDHLFGDLYYFFKRFEGYIRVSAQNHFELQNRFGHEISYESSLRSCLNIYDFKDEQSDYFMDSILGSRYRNRVKTDKNDLSVYNRGFRYHSFIDNDNHDFFTRIGMRSVSSSPESILLNILGHEGLKFIGISATANINTVTSNFNSHYLENYPLIYRPHEISDSEDKRLNDFISSRLGDYDGKVRIDVDLIDPEDPDPVYKDGVYQHRLLEMTRLEDEFDRNRFIRLIRAYRKFIETEDARSMIAFMNLFPKNSGLFSHDNISKAFRMVLEEHDPSSPLMEHPYEVLRTNRFGEVKRDLLRKLSEGSKMFLLTTYHTVGAGQNLQYKIPEGVHTEFIGDRPELNKGYKDIDAIYLDTPTYIVPGVKPGCTEDLVVAVSMYGFLHYATEIDSREKDILVRHAFHRYMGIPSEDNLSVKEKDSFKAAYARRVIQAMGRICRTHNKNAVIHIMADIDLAEVFSGDIQRYGKRFNKEFLALFEKIKTVRKTESPSVSGLDSQADRICSGYIGRLCSSDKDGWSENEMSAWKDMRRFALVHPTCQMYPRSNVGSSMYVRLPVDGKTVRYSKEGDYQRIMIHEKGNLEVSEESCRLPKLMRIPHVKDYFQSHGYCCSWEENTRIMCPTLFNNIYKGALGEAAGRAILESNGFDIAEIEDGKAFEKFDYILKDGVYVDFKHWSGSVMSEEEGTMKALKKLREIDGRTAVIINILKPENQECKDRPYHPDNCPEILVIPFLYDGNDEINPYAISALNEVMRG